jgi:hypothetical protein
MTLEIIEKDLEMMCWEDIKNAHPNAWVVLANPILEGTRISQGIVLSANADKRVASIEGGERRGGFKKFTLAFTGKSEATRRIGILKTRTS